MIFIVHNNTGQFTKSSLTRCCDVDPPSLSPAQHTSSPAPLSLCHTPSDWPSAGSHSPTPSTMQNMHVTWMEQKRKWYQIFSVLVRLPSWVFQKHHLCILWRWPWASLHFGALGFSAAPHFEREFSENIKLRCLKNHKKTSCTCEVIPS